MPTKKINPIEEHFEKGILGISVIVLLYFLFAYMITSPTSVELGMTKVRPGQAYALILKEAESLDQKAKQQESQWPEIQVQQETGNAPVKLGGVAGISGFAVGFGGIAERRNVEWRWPELHFIKN